MPKTGLLFVVLLAFHSFGQTATRIKESTHRYALNDKKIALKITQFGDNNDFVMVNLHADETTGVEAAKTILSKTGGTLITIENNAERLISFTSRKKTTRFDPNRIFTETGIKATLHKHNKQRGKEAIKTVNDFAKFCLDRIPATPVLIALHNNEDKGLSVHSYHKGGACENDAVSVNINDSHDPDNFFLTTNEQLFRLLASAGYNTVLQHNRKAKDDGSLSIYYGRRNRQYINIEAETGKLDVQKQMIEAVMGIIRKR